MSESVASSAEVRGKSWWGNLSTRQRSLYSIIALLAGMSVILYWHLCQVLAKPHYQFVVFVPLGTALLWRRGIFLDGKVRGSTGLGSLPLLATCLLLDIVAILIWSPTVGFCATLFTVLSVIYYFFGFAGVKRAFPGWLLLWIMVPLPFGLDEELIESLRNFSTQWASRILEWLEIRHLTEGNIIRTPSKDFFVADACTGIHSLFVIFGFAIFSAFWNRRFWHQTIGLLMCGFAVVIIENLVRLTAVVIAWQNQLDLTIEWRHKLFGAIVFCISLGLVWSADRLVSSLLPFRFRISWGRISEEEDEDGETDALTKTKNGIMSLSPITLVSTLIVLLALQFFMMPSLPNIIENFSNPWEKLPELSKELLPENEKGYARQDFRFETRDGDYPFGKFGQIWVYQKGDLVCEVSLNYPYLGLKDLCKCYEQTGWKIRSVDRLEAFNEKAIPPMTRAIMDKPFAGFSVVLFSDIDENGKVNTVSISRERKSLSSRVAARFKSFVSLEKIEEIEMNPTAQIQMLVSSPKEIDEATRVELEELFVNFREKLMTETSMKLKEVR